MNMSCYYEPGTERYYACSMCGSRRILGCIFCNPQEKDVESMENLEILFAHEANRIAKEKSQKDIKEKLKEIEEKIRDAANNGKFSITLDETLKKQVKNELENRGYAVQLRSHYYEHGCKISWDK